MPRNPERHWWRPAAWVLVLALTACATTPPVTTPLSPAAQRAALLRLENFSFAGRVAVKPQKAGAISVDWQQRQDRAKVKLTGPFGTGGMQLEYSPTLLRINTGSAGKFEDADAERVLVDQLGFLPPFDSLRFWVLGMPAPSSAATETRDEADLLTKLSQQGWEVSYERHMLVATAAGGVQLPAKLVATRDNLSLTLVIDRWPMK